MTKDKYSLYDDLIVSGHSFENDETLTKFQYMVLNTVLVVMAIFSFIFGTLSVFEISPLGVEQTVSNYILSAVAVVLIFRLRGPKSRYMQVAYIMYLVAFADFMVALLFVQHDEFRIIWFYLLVFAAYITGGVRSGNIIALVSIAAIIASNVLYDLKLSETGIISSVLGLVIASLFFRAYAKKIIDFESEINEQKSLIITQSRLAAMGEMMSMIAHQWRQPLSTTTLMISNERIKFMLDGKEDTEYEKMLDKISDTMVYLSDTIDDFQTYFQPQKESQHISTCELINRVLNFVETRLTIDKVKVHVNKCDDKEIDTYANEVIQVLINIINNAIDALAERNVQDRNIWINLISSDDSIEITVEDSAGGIEDDIIGKVFEPYFSTKSKNGTGLGLYMSKMIIEKHINGRIDVVNTPNGALFTIFIPTS